MYSNTLFWLLGLQYASVLWNPRHQHEVWGTGIEEAQTVDDHTTEVNNVMAEGSSLQVYRSPKVLIMFCLNILNVILLNRNIPTIVKHRLLLVLKPK